MLRLKKTALAALVALALAAGGSASAHHLAGDPSQWGVAKKGSFDITELHGERAAKKGSFDITELHGERTAKKGSFDIAGDPSQWGAA